MKRFIIILMILSCLFSTAMAHPFDSFHVKFDGSAAFTGVHEIDETLTLEKLSVYEENDTFMIGFGDYDMTVTFSGDDVISVSVLLKNKEAEADYLMTCLAVILTLGEIDFNAMGSLVNQLAYARNGKNQYPAMIGQDTFLLSPKEDYVYWFTYMNNDRRYR